MNFYYLFIFFFSLLTVDIIRLLGSNILKIFIDLKSLILINHK